MASSIIVLVLGGFFGFSLNKAGLTKYNKIVNVFRFTDMAVLKFMMTALAVGNERYCIILRGLGLVTFPNIPATYIVGNLIGGSHIRGRDGPDRFLTRHLCRRVRRRKTRLHHPWFAWFS